MRLEIEDYIQIAIVLALIVYLFYGSYYLKDVDNTKLIIGAFIGSLGTNLRNKLK